MQYNLNDIIKNEYIYIQIQKGMYGLKQAAILAYTQVSSLLKKSGYQPIFGSLGMWKYNTRKTLVCLCVDEFGIKYHNRDDITLIENALKPQYTAKIDWGGKKS